MRALKVLGIVLLVLLVLAGGGVAWLGYRRASR